MRITVSNLNDTKYVFQHELGVCDDSLCPPSRFVLSITMGTCNVHTLGVRQQNVVPDFLRSSNSTSAFDLSIQHLSNLDSPLSSTTSVLVASSSISITTSQQHHESASALFLPHCHHGTPRTALHAEFLHCLVTCPQSFRHERHAELNYKQLACLFPKG